MCAPRRIGPGRETAGFGLVEVMVGLVIALVTMLFVGFGAIAMAATANTTIQLAVPDELRGRVISVYTTVFAGATPSGSLLMGSLASRVGVTVTMALAGIATATAYAATAVL